MAMNIYHAASEAFAQRRFKDSIVLIQTALERVNTINELSPWLMLLAQSYIELSERQRAIDSIIQACRLGSDHARSMAIDWCQRE